MEALFAGLAEAEGEAGLNDKAHEQTAVSQSVLQAVCSTSLTFPNSRWLHFQ